jgi:uncharacterized protein (TIGR02757 family)
LNSGHKLISLLHHSPHQFVLSHTPADLEALSCFAHRTFRGDDVLYFIHFLKFHYSSNASLENAFTDFMKKGDDSVENALIGFHNYFFSAGAHLPRTKKHVSSPAKNSACKRLNMFLRWMVRSNSEGIDFGIWKKIKPSQLICPCDVHVFKTARRLGLIQAATPNWKAALELTHALRKLHADDPVKYDFALFGMSASKQKKSRAEIVRNTNRY